jgi:hypothetical protein
MKTNWQHQKDAITTDQKNRTDDEHLHEEDKRHLKVDSEQLDAVPQGKKATPSAKQQP